jgi:hypothetical protein
MCKPDGEKIPEMPQFAVRLKITTATARIPTVWTGLIQVGV